MQYTKLNETTLKITENITQETELTRDSVLDAIANIDNQLSGNERRKEELLLQKQQQLELLWEFDKQWIITTKEFIDKQKIEESLQKPDIQIEPITPEGTGKTL